MNLLKDKSGLSETVSMLGLVLICAIILSCILGVLAQMHKINLLDRFAHELILKASDIGACSGDEIEKRYEELVASTGLTPDYEFTATYFNIQKKTVQYGDTITLKLTLKTKLIGFSNFSIPQTLTTTSTEQSMQYWK